MNQKYDRRSISGFIFGLCLTLLCITLPSAQAATLASIGATIEGLKAYEGPKEGVASDQRLYSQKFLQQSSRYIWWELSLTYQAQGQETEIPIVVRYYSPDGSLFLEYNSTLTIQPDWTASSHWSGVGYIEPGRWSQGKYTIKLFEGTTQIAASSFSILTDREAADLLLDWLEPQYPAYISPSGQPTLETNSGIIYRSYTTTNTLCGTYGGHLYFMDALSKVYDLGEVAQWLSQVEEGSDSALSITFNSTDGGTVTTRGLAQITVPPGAIAKNSDGSPGKVLISIEPNIPQDKWPAPLPDGYEAVSKVYLFGPSGFVFAGPVQIYLPAGDIESPSGLVVLWYKASESQWVPLPLSDLDSTNHRLGVSVFELGYFLIASSPLISSNGEYWYSASDSIPDRRVGGVRLIHNSSSSLTLPSGYYYTMTIAAVVYTYPAIGWPNLVGDGVGTGSEPTGGPRELTRMMNIPQGTYTFEITRQKAGTISQLPGPVQTYSSRVTVQVGPFTSAFGWGADAFTGWTDIAPLPEGTWQNGTPAIWPVATVPYGTGDLHITLEWENTSESSTDLDLHLYGPDSIHVWYSAQQSADGSIRLDRDWKKEVGHAVENIYSLTPVPSGEYTIKVLNYSGSIPKFFKVRAKLPDGTVKTFSSTMTQNKQEVTILTFTVAAGGGGTTVKGNVTHYVDGFQDPQPLFGARVILGTGFNVRISSGVILEYKTIVADVRTDDQGRFTVNVPTGNFDVFIWKEGYVPATGETATWTPLVAQLQQSQTVVHNWLSFQHR